MESKQIKNFKVPASLCDMTGRLGITGLFELFQDMASEHGKAIHLGRDDLAEKGLIWIVSKTKILIRERPEMIRDITAITWPEAPGRIRCNRYYTVSAGDKILAEGKNEWAMLEAATGRPHKLADAYPAELVHLEDTACSEPFSKISDDFSQCEEISKYIVRSVDIDASRHMNNVAYVRAALGAFSCESLETMNIREAEAVYKAQCYEGEELSIRLRKTDGSVEIGIVKPDGKTAAIIRLA